ncbi:MAG TPA: glycosyltransferase [Bacteroidales bacterium]|nr:glycosyltransferase [Bacteroidales bacterium]
MTLSVIIVNYNVKHFIEQCLLSVYDALDGIDGEVIVVDNNSVDGSVAMIKERFPQTILIANNENLGFSKANNQALKIAKGKYILLLNPDTIVEKDTFAKTIAFMEEHPDAGALGVKLVNGKGQYLPESKRGIPTPWVSFCKMSNLIKLFPHSKIFAKYYMGHLNPDEINEVEILSGAFMLIRKDVLDQIGFLDESFFMYGEDIDLSYRILQAGYKNYYYPQTRIIHYKGESTKKGSINYIYNFYNAMLIFAQKHFYSKGANWMKFLISIAIYFRASLAFIQKIIKKIWLPILDLIILYGGLYGITTFWENIRFQYDAIIYPRPYVYYALLIYSLVWILAIFLNGGYDKPFHKKHFFTGIISGSIILLLIYGLMSEQFRFSRTILLLGTMWALLSLIGVRYLLEWLGVGSWGLLKQNKKIAICGDINDIYAVKNILEHSNVPIEQLFYINPSDDYNSDQYYGSLNQLPEIIRIYKLNEVIFCTNSVSMSQIIDSMSYLSDYHVDFRISSPTNEFLLSSRYIISPEDVFLYELNSIAKPVNRRRKRVFDFFTSLALLILYPLYFLFIKKPRKALKNIINVLINKKTWVGYCSKEYPHNLPKIPEGIFNLLDGLGFTSSTNIYNEIDFNYARDYHVMTDLSILLRNLGNLGKG